MRDHLLLCVNGRPCQVRGDDAFLTLAEFLRQRSGLTGTKVVCAEGDCGACSVLVGRPSGERLRYEPIDACIVFLHQLDRTHVVTVEGLKVAGELSPLQGAMVRHFGSQCGFCTPGIVVALTALLEQGGALGDEQVRYGLSGNLCRCTGYVQILEAAAAVDGETAPRLKDLYPDPELLASLQGPDPGVLVEGSACSVFVPATLDEAVELRAEHPDALVVAGATDLGVQWNKGRLDPRTLLTLDRQLEDFDRVADVDGRMVAGAGATWSTIESFSRERVPELHDLLRLFGAPQIRNLATIGGNLANASPIADSLPFLFVTGAEVEARSRRGSRRIPVEELYRGYKQTVLAPDELLTRVLVPLPRSDEALKLYKISKRRDLDISTFTAAFLLRLDGGRIASARLAYGGAAPVVLRLPRTETLLEGRQVSRELMREAGSVARTEISPISDVRGNADFRYQLAENLPLRFFHDTRREAAAA